MVQKSFAVIYVVSDYTLNIFHFSYLFMHIIDISSAVYVRNVLLALFVINLWCPIYVTNNSYRLFFRSLCEYGSEAKVMHRQMIVHLYSTLKDLAVSMIWCKNCRLLLKRRLSQSELAGWRYDNLSLLIFWLNIVGNFSHCLSKPSSSM